MSDKFLEWLQSEIKETDELLNQEIEEHGWEGDESLADYYGSIRSKLHVVLQVYRNIKAQKEQV